MCFVVYSDGAQYLSKLLGPIEPDEHEDLLDRVITAVQQLPLATAFITEQHIATAAKVR